MSEPRKEVLSDTVTLWLGDCRDVPPTIGRVDAVVTDPPYGIGLTTKTSDYRDSKYFDNGNSIRASVLYDDDPDKIRDLVHEVFSNPSELAQRALIFAGPAMLWEYPKPASLGCVYTAAGAGRTAWGFQCSHPILFYGKDPFLQDGKGGRPNSLNDDQPNREKIDHPCPKPLAWMLWAVNRSSRLAETILDPFMGSGTTGVACVNLGRSFIGIEREPKYFDIARRRITEAIAQPRFEFAGPVKSKQEALAL